MPNATPNSKSAVLPADASAPQWDRRVWLAAGVIVLAVWVAYANSLSTPFVFDDLKSVAENPSIRHLGRLADVLSPPNNVTGAVGRPVVNLSLAINYALGGLDPKGYHFFNTVIHALAALVLFGIVRRTLLQPGRRERFGTHAIPLALGIALLWALHPLQTESVTCIVQRTESLMGLFYLLTLYGFIRGTESRAPLKWQIFTVAVCLVGMATKEVMVSAPLLVLLYDRTFVAGTFHAAWRQRWVWYLALAATWILLAWLMVGARQRGGGVGLGLGVSGWDYALTQCRAILLYLRLSIWPDPLVVDYGGNLVRRLGEVWPQAVVLVGLVVSTLVALWRRPVLGFLGFWFFAILAPSSSFVPLIAQTIAEHRMYLPLATVVTLVVLGGYHWLGRGALLIGVALVVAAGWRTVRRNADYRDPLTLWGVTASQQPDNARAQMNFGTALLDAGRLEEARARFETAARIAPTFPESRYSLATVLLRLNRLDEALVAAKEAVRIKPDYAEAHYLAGTLLLKHHQADAAIKEYETALRLRPDFADVHHTLGGTLAMLGRTAEALPHYEAALHLQPDDPRLQQELASVHYSMGNAFMDLRRYDEAVAHYVVAIQLRPDAPPIHNNLGNAFVELGRLDEAKAQFEEAIRLNPEYATARNNLERLQAARPR